jgi:hypothetical protein
VLATSSIRQKRRPASSWHQVSSKAGAATLAGLPLLYLHGLSSGDFVPALGQFLGSAAGLSAAVITRLTGQWQAEQRAFAGRDLSGADYVYLRADGIHVNIRLEAHKLCLLVMIGVRADGRKELIALADGALRELCPPESAILRRGGLPDPPFAQRRLRASPCEPTAESRDPTGRCRCMPILNEAGRDPWSRPANEPPTNDQETRPPSWQSGL